jgi:APA family basic amino acid/polyamine antiporter
MIGFGIVVLLLLFYSHSSFVASVNSEMHRVFGISNAYGRTEAFGAKAGYHWVFGLGPLGPTMLLVPMMMFFLLFPNWGATLYGEVRGASDFKRVFTGMFVGLWITVILSVIFLFLAEKTIGWSFYNNANAAFTTAKGVFPIWPYPVLLASWLVHSKIFQVALLLLMSLWFFGWVGTLFLSSTRVIFAAAFDRVLPDAAASVSEKRKVPLASLVLMLLPAVGLSALYAYWGKFSTYTLDATLVIAVTYLVTSFAAVILPWRKPDLWKASPASRFKVLGVPLVPLCGLVTMGLLVYNLVEWLSNSAYGVNNTDSLVFMGIMYALAIVVYVTARLVRKRQGIDLALINKEIPVE